MTLRERFERKVSPEPTSGCHLWTAAVAGKGYGVINHGGVMRYAHRLAWEFAYGPIPEGLCALHRCDVPACVNVAHLFLGTVADNNRDMAAKGRAVGHNAAKTQCPKGHPYVGSNLYICEDGRRVCVTCNRENHRTYRKRA